MQNSVRCFVSLETGWCVIDEPDLRNQTARGWHSSRLAQVQKCGTTIANLTLYYTEVSIPEFRKQFSGGPIVNKLDELLIETGEMYSADDVLWYLNQGKEMNEQKNKPTYP